MNLARASIERNRVTTVALLVIAAPGVSSFFGLPQSEDPGFLIRIAVVQTVFPGASPERVEQLVAQTLERFGRIDAVVNHTGGPPKGDLVEISDEAERRNPNVVKAACVFVEGGDIARALYFSRAPVPWTGAEDRLPLYHHIGLYAYRRQALKRFVALPPSALEQREKLEQLRALEAGMQIAVVRVDTLPLGVDTPADLARARRLLAPGAGG